MNKVILCGRLGRDPELRYTPSGYAVCNFSVATNRVWIDANGQKQERTEWHEVVAWRKTAENCKEYLRKGREVLIEGRIEERSFESNKYKDEEGKPATIKVKEIQADRVKFIGSASQNKETTDNGEVPESV